MNKVVISVKVKTQKPRIEAIASMNNITMDIDTPITEAMTLTVVFPLVELLPVPD